MKISSFGFTFIISIIIFSTLFFSYSNPTSLNTIAYGSFSPSSLSGENQQLIDKIAIKITEAKPSADYVSVKKVLERLALQKQNKGENIQESLTKILNQVSQNPESKVVDSIVNLALKESPSNTQQQNQLTPQPTNNFSNRNETTVSEKALEIDPNQTGALLDKSNALYAQERYDEAIQYLDKILQIDPSNTYALNSKADALYFLERNEEAIQNYDKVLQIDPSNVYALNGKADVLYALDRDVEAIQNYDKILQIDPSNIFLTETMKLYKIMTKYYR
jgi:tetratricopeptide (TPR) repeat protein